jgi:hypothetical protein
LIGFPRVPSIYTSILLRGSFISSHPYLSRGPPWLVCTRVKKPFSSLLLFLLVKSKLLLKAFSVDLCRASL